MAEWKAMRQPRLCRFLDVDNFRLKTRSPSDRNLWFLSLEPFFPSVQTPTPGWSEEKDLLILSEREERDSKGEATAGGVPFWATVQNTSQLRRHLKIWHRLLPWNALTPSHPRASYRPRSRGVITSEITPG
jgi:hypothetical protein